LKTERKRTKLEGTTLEKQGKTLEKRAAGYEF
jgi:hypothetical protein